MSTDVQFCDTLHQPIAFLGTCPICRKRQALRGDSPLDTNKSPYAADLVRALRVYFLREAAAFRGYIKPDGTLVTAERHTGSL